METLTENVPTLAPQLNRQITELTNQSNFLPMPVQVSAIVNRVKAVKEIVSQVFQSGNHFGEIPGTAKNADGSAKMVLLKPGFDALCMAFQFAPEFIKQPESIENDKFINIVYKCKIVHSPTERVIATGDGSCNSKEEKYRWTKTTRVCPQCKGEYIRTSKPEDQQGFYCWKKLGGCGATFPKNAPEIVSQPEGRKENDNPWNFHNTITKMAQKRAGMAAIITACGLSSDFTQDLEDFEINDKSKRDEPVIEIKAAEYYEEPPENYSPSIYEPEFDPSLNIESTPQELARDPDLEKIKNEIRKESRSCRTKEDFMALKKSMEARGPLYLDAKVTSIVNKAYLYRFPKQTQSKGA
jgi:hypothetical protein